MPSRKVVEIGPARQRLAAGQAVRPDDIRSFPDLPVLPETLLGMELQIRKRAADLNEITRLILSDLGAALQIMRLASREYSHAESKARPVEEIVADIGLEACLEAMARRPARRSAEQPAVFETWAHSRKIAELCFEIAQSAPGSAHPADAYLVGLFHALGSLPGVLGWERGLPIAANPTLVGLRIAEAWAFPACVVEFFTERRKRQPSGHWVGMVDHAHKLAALSSTRLHTVNGF